MDESSSRRAYHATSHGILLPCTLPCPAYACITECWQMAAGNRSRTAEGRRDLGKFGTGIARVLKFTCRSTSFGTSNQAERVAKEA